MLAFHSVSKTFATGSGAKLLAAMMRQAFSGRKDNKRFYALRDVSFEIASGESLAVIGANGAGKSTLLSIVTGLCQPDSGSVEVTGRIAALLDLGSGFHSDLTGKENLLLNGAVLGMNQKQIGALKDQIIEFAELEDFIDRPLRTFSSGMVIRLAFSIAIHTDPDILIIDEVLAIGDKAFQDKCTAKISDFRRAGKTLLFVSHALPALMQFCQKALWLDHGKVVEFGDAAKVIANYGARVPEIVTMRK